MRFVNLEEHRYHTLEYSKNFEIRRRNKMIELDFLFIYEHKVRELEN